MRLRRAFIGVIRWLTVGAIVAFAAAVLPWLAVDPGGWPAATIEEGSWQLTGSPTGAERDALPPDAQAIVRQWRWSGAAIQRRWFGEVSTPRWTDPPPEPPWNASLAGLYPPKFAQPVELKRLASGWPLRFLHGSFWAGIAVASTTTGVRWAPSSITTLEWTSRVGPPPIVRLVPAGVRAVPLLIDGAMLGAASWAFWAGARALVGVRRAARGTCARCGYELLGPRLAAARSARRWTWRRISRWTIVVAAVLAIGATISTGWNAMVVLWHEPSAGASGRKVHFVQAPLAALPWVGATRLAALEEIARRGGPGLDDVVVIEELAADVNADRRWLYVGRPGERAAVATIDVGRPWRSLRVHQAGVVERWNRWVDLKFAETPNPIWRTEVLWRGFLPSIVVWTIALLAPAMLTMWLFTFVRALGWRTRIALGFGARSRQRCPECGTETVTRNAGACRTAGAG
ncbi:MAG: hypothetical protein U0575_09910 [Phycisphaerales bacterium]